MNESASAASAMSVRPHPAIVSPKPWSVADIRLACSELVVLNYVNLVNRLLELGKSTPIAVPLTRPKTTAKIHVM